MTAAREFPIPRRTGRAAPLLAAALFLLAGCRSETGEETLPPALVPEPAAELPEPPPADAAVRSVVLILGDGLGFAQITAARTALRGVGEPLYFERFPYTGWQTTHALAGSVTDSAAGATALATGYKTWSGRLGVDGEGRRLHTLVEAARARGMATGLATTSYLLDATPSAFVAHVTSRRMGEEIAEQMATSGVDLLAGARGRHLRARGGREGAAVRAFEAAGFFVAKSWEEASAAPAGPLLTLLPDGQMADPDREPTLADVASLALERLDGDEEGFFLLLEDEETDTASHREELPRMIAGVRALEAAARVAVEYAAGRGDTLVLLTADHETGGMVLESAGRPRPPRPEYTTDEHTGVPVPIYAYGAGAHLFTGVLDNTEIALRLAELLDLQLEPPEGG